MSDLLGGVLNVAKVGDKSNSKLKVQSGKEEHSGFSRGITHTIIGWVTDKDLKSVSTVNRPRYQPRCSLVGLH